MDVPKWKKNQSLDSNRTDFNPVELQEKPSRSLLVNTVARDSRQIIRGPKLRFIEDLQSNLKLIKYLVPSPELIAETFPVGTAASKQVVMVYLQNVANPGIVSEVKDRIQSIKTRTLFDPWEFWESKASSSR
ncbi:MAG TPA: spore germination protein [Bacillota bacterium]|nr:spore germination protein [Bacillota bacterium]